LLRLFVYIELLIEHSQKQQEDIEVMKDEIRILKGEKKRPKFKPSKLDESTNEALLNISKFNQFQLGARHLPQQILEAQASLRLLNRKTQLGLPNSVRIEWKEASKAKKLVKFRFIQQCLKNSRRVEIVDFAH
jgi:hypothetical protein